MERLREFAVRAVQLVWTSPAEYNPARRRWLGGVAAVTGLAASNVLYDRVVPPALRPVWQYRTVDGTASEGSDTAHLPCDVAVEVAKTPPERFAQSAYEEVTGAITAPLLEEPLFRGLPALLYNLATKAARRFEVQGPLLWKKLGVPSSLLFALAHIRITKVPLPQFVLGLTTWYAMRQFGLSAAIAVHSAYNAVIGYEHCRTTQSFVSNARRIAQECRK